MRLRKCSDSCAPPATWLAVGVAAACLVISTSCYAVIGTTLQHRSARTGPLAAVLVNEAVRYCLNGYGDSVATMTVVGPSQRDQLQTLLDQKGVLRLQSGDYQGSLSRVTLHSGQQLIGVASTGHRDGSSLPKIVVAAGTSNAVVDGVDPESLEFSPGGATQANCFARIHHARGGIVSSGASLESNVFLDVMDAVLKVDNSAGGYLHNNRFIRVKEQTASPQISIRGDPGRQSWGNVILWHNDLTPWGQGIHVDNQADLAIVGVDAEAWNQNGAHPHDAMLGTGPMGTLRLMSFAGGDNCCGSPTPVLDVAADELQAYNMDINTPAKPATRLQSTTQRSAIVDGAGLSPIEDHAAGAVRLHAERDSVDVNGRSLATTSLTSAQQDSLRQMWVTPATSRTGQPWERPSFAPIPDPVAARPGNPNRDDTGYIQHLIDTQGIATLPAGTYYISRPLVINTAHGLRGAGAGATAIVAKDPSIDMVISQNHFGSSGPGHPSTPAGLLAFTLADLTLQGGRNGIHHDNSTAGGGAGVTGIVLSHVTFRNMSEAGIFIDNILGWDNNWFDFLNFYHNGAGIKQRSQLFLTKPPPDLNGEMPFEGYMDKNVFYHNQFVGNGTALDLQAMRQSNDNMWVNSLFQDNGQAMHQSGWVGTVFANSDFTNNGGAAVLESDRPLSCVSCFFRADARGVTMLSGGRDPHQAPHCEGCTFHLGTSTTAHILGGAMGYFYNSSADMPMGQVASGLLVNSSFAKDPALSQQIVLLQNGRAKTILPGAPTPVPQLLFGTAFDRSSPTRTPEPAAAPAPMTSLALGLLAVGVVLIVFVVGRLVVQIGAYRRRG